MLLEFFIVVFEDVIVDVIMLRVKIMCEVYWCGWCDKLIDVYYGFGWCIYDYVGEMLNYYGGWVKGYCVDVLFLFKYCVGYVMLMNVEFNFINIIIVDFW